MGSLTSPKSARHHVSPTTTGGFTYLPGYTLTPAQPPAGLSYPPASPHRLPTTHQVPPHPQTIRRRPRLEGLAQQGSAGTLLRGYGNINPLSIDYASRPRLRPRLTQGGLTWPWNPWSSGGRVSHPAFATHACILTPTTSTARSPCCFSGGRTLPYPPTHLDPHPKRCRPDTRVSATASAVCLSPATLSARNHLTSELLRTLSRVAASKPTSWLSMRPHILFHLAHA
jgi:hypothetical protein